MPRTPIWKSIADALTRDIAEARYSPGDKLPTEAELSARFGVNRHTVRHALKSLSAQALVQSRRGSGVFVATTPTDYPIGRRVRFHQSLKAAGHMPAKEILLLETRAADAREAEALAIATGAKVHVYEGLSLSDNAPIAIFRSIFPAVRLPHMLPRLRKTRSVTAAFEAHGISDYTRHSTRLTAKLATATQALHLRIPEGAPVLRSIGVNIDPEGIPIEHGQTWFAGDRVTLTLTDP